MIDGVCLGHLSLDSEHLSMPQLRKGDGDLSGLGLVECFSAQGGQFGRSSLGVCFVTGPGPTGSRDLARLTFQGDFQ